VKFIILAIGKAGVAEKLWVDEYIKRMKAKVAIKEFTAPKGLPPAETQKNEAALLLKSIPEKAFVVALDERGKDISSRTFATHIATWQERSHSDIVFIIGGADGLTDDVRGRANFILGFGQLTWPHRLVRVMLMEQLYRAQQINIGHPYHRD
jgi:23S rRNA (pseudouridine1915-N3)-methyltransferase